MKTNFPKDFDVEAAVQAIIDDEPDLIAERDNLIEALTKPKQVSLHVRQKYQIRLKSAVKQVYRKVNLPKP